MLTPRTHKIAVYIAFCLLTAWLLLSSLPPEIIGTNRSGHEATHEEGDKLSIDRRIARYTLWLAGFTGVLAISTIGLWIATGLTLAHSRQASERQLRAYVSAQPDGVVDFIPGDQVVARICFQNTGSIFAKGVRTFLDRQLSDNDDLPEDALPIDEAKISGDNVIAPNANILYATKAVRKSEIAVNRDNAERRGGKYYLYVWGIVLYNDGFVDGRYTKFCHRYNFSGVPDGVYTIPRENYRYHHRGNKIDDKD